MNSMAYKFGDVIVRIHPDMDVNGNQVLICIGDEPVWSPDVYDASPKNRDGFCKYLEYRIGVIPGTEGPNEVVLSGAGNRPKLTRKSTGFTAEMWLFTQRGYTGPDGRGRNSIDFAANIYMNDPLKSPRDACFSDPALWDRGKQHNDNVDLNDITYKELGSWAAKDDPSTPEIESPLFTQSDHDMFCSKGNWVNGKTCNDANIPFSDPVPASDAACADNNCPYSMGEQLCKSLKTHEDDYEACLFDYCSTCDEEVVAAWEDWEKVIHPEPTCADGMAECSPADVCSKSSTMNTLNIAQNNLGGAGPDDGPEEIRYTKAASVNGKSVDLVVTTDGQYSAKKASVNGVSGSFGIVNVKCGTEVNLVFNVVDSETGAPVPLDNVAISWYDIDEGKKAKGRSSVTGCGDGMLTSSSTELTLKKLGSCWSATSSTAGTAADNPSSPFTLNMQQRERVVTFPFSGVSTFTSALNVENGYGARNFQFAIEPGVACTGE